MSISGQREQNNRDLLMEEQKKADDPQEIMMAERGRATGGINLYSLPLWFIFLAVGWVLILISILTNELYSNIFSQLIDGLPMTLRVAASAYLFALAIGLTVGVIRSEVPKQPAPGSSRRFISFIRLIIYQLATFYVEVMRGLPIIIVLVIGAFVIYPSLRDNIIEPLCQCEITTRGGAPEPAIFALGLTYGAYISETFRAGVQSIERGQMEAAKSLGMTWFQAMRLIILPQAVRRVLPPLGNDIVSMIKDSALVSVLGVQDVTQIARTSAGQSFRYLETYMTVAFIYLTLTVLGSLMVRALERSLKNGKPLLPSFRIIPGKRV